MTRPRIEILLTGDRVSLRDMCNMARLAEEAGLGGVWITEVFRDVFVPLAAIATVTKRVRIGSNVARWTRPPPTLERTASDLYELSDGRFILGLGSSTREWNEKWYGIRYERPLRRMQEYVEAVRTLWMAAPDSPVTYEGEFFQVRDYVRFNGPLERPVPIYLGATRTGMARLAGKMADGVNFNSVLSAAYIRSVMGPALVDGAKRSGRSLQDIEVGASPIAAVSDNGAMARRWARQELAFYAAHTNYFKDVMRFHGVANDFQVVRELVLRGNLEAAFGAVTDEMVDSLAIAGTPDAVRRKAERYEDSCAFLSLSPAGFLLSHEELLQNQRMLIETFAA